MTRAVTINQATITRAIKAIDKSGVPMIIEIKRDGSLLIIPPELTDFSHSDDFDEEIDCEPIRLY